MTEFASRTFKVAPFQVMAILEQAQTLAATGMDVIHLEVGEPDFSTPKPITEAAIRALEAGHTGYTPSLGLMALRQKISDFYRSRYGLAVDASRIVITPGASGALLLLMAARLEVGEEILLADPGYPCNQHFAQVFEAKATLIATEASSGFQLTFEQVESHWSEATKAVLLASPANPTGALIEEDALKAIHATVKARGGELWVDEIYHGLTYHDGSDNGSDNNANGCGPHPNSALALGEEVVVINSFSKYFGMTGWRLGWMVVPEHYVPVIDKLAQNLFLAPSTPAQYGALAAFDEAAIDIMEARRDEFKRRRDYLLQALPKLGFKIPVMAQGAFYLYLDASAFTDNSQDFCQRLLQATGVALTPGVDFGDQHGQYFVRVAYTTRIERLQQAVDRMASWLAEESQSSSSSAGSSGGVSGDASGGGSAGAPESERNDAQKGADHAV